MVLLKRGILLPEGSRCCSDHLYKRHLSFDALYQIKSKHSDNLTLDADSTKQLLDDFRTTMNTSKSFDFDDPSALDDNAYYDITGLHKSEKNTLSMLLL